MVLYRTWTQADHDNLARRVLAVLPGPDDDPASTTLIRSRFPDLDAFEREMYVRRALNTLVAGGWAERVTVAGDARAFWRLTGKDGHDRGSLPHAD